MNMSQQPTPKFLLDENVHFERREIGGRTTFVVRHPTLEKYFHMGVAENRVAMLLDGTRTIDEMMVVLQAEGIDWTGEEVAELVLRFVHAKLARPVEGDLGNFNTPSVSWKQRSLKTLSGVISQRIPLFACNRLATKLHSIFGFLFSIPAMVIWAILVTSGFVIFFQQHEEFTSEITKLFDNRLWIAMIVMWVLAKVVHEFGHATAAKHHGVHVGKAGVMFFLMAPLAFVDVTDAWKLPSRWKRMQISLAGVYVELAVAAVALWMWWWLEDGLLRHLAAQCFLVAGPATLLVNANPLLRLDGYYVLSDLTDIPNLRMHGRDQLGNWLNRVLVGLPETRSLLSGWRRPFATVHAFCSVIFQVIWMTGLVVAVAWWAEGLGWVLAIAAGLMWAVLPMVRWVVKVWKSSSNEPLPETRSIAGHPRVRLAIVLGGACALVGYFLTAPSPLGRRVPVVVRYDSEQVVRASASAFVKDVRVKNGERVVAGTLLIELQDPERMVHLAERRDQLKVTSINEVEARKAGDLSVAAAESEHADSLRRQIAELETEVADLITYAQRDGLVIGANLDSMIGRFVEQGDSLMTVCDPQEMELLAAISPSDIEAYQRVTIGDRPMVVRLRGGQRFHTKPSPLRPQAINRLPHPALGANVGGPIPVEMQSTDSDLKSGPKPTQPQMESVTPLDPVTSSRIRSGQVGTMSISDTRSIARRVLDALR